MVGIGGQHGRSDLSGLASRHGDVVSRDGLDRDDHDRYVCDVVNGKVVTSAIHAAVLGKAPGEGVFTGSEHQIVGFPVVVVSAIIELWLIVNREDSVVIDSARTFAPCLEVEAESVAFGGIHDEGQCRDAAMDATVT